MLKKGCRENGLRIAILMINSPGSKHTYTDCATMLNLNYANKHRYDFILERCPTDVDVSWKWKENDQYVIVWYKPELLLKYLPYYHYIMFIDSDAIYKNTDISIENIIDNLDKKYAIIIADDKSYSQWGGNEVNTGVIIVQNCPKSFEILNRWIDSTKNGDVCEKWRGVHPREQACLSDLYITEFRDDIYIHKSTFMNSANGEWIVHLMGKKSNERNAIMTNYFTKEFGSLILCNYLHILVKWLMYSLIFLFIIFLFIKLYIYLKKR